MRIKRETALLLAILSAALAIRIFPIAANLAFALSLDETDYIETALRFGTGSLQISYLHGAFYQLILFVEYAAYFLIGRVLGSFSSSTDFFLSYLRQPDPFFLIARLTAAFCGLGVVALSYEIASRLYCARVGLAAALFTGFSLLMFQMSYLALADLPAVFLLMLAVCLAVRSVENPGEFRLYCFSAALVGFAAACKYHAGMGIATVLVAAFIKSRDQFQWAKGFLQLAVLGCVAAFVGFCAGMPQFVINPSGLFSGLSQLRGTWLEDNPAGSAWSFIFTHHLRNGLGLPLEMAVFLGFARALVKRSNGDLLLVSFPIPFYLVFMQSMGVSYHLLPAIPFLLILAARLTDEVSVKLWRGESIKGSLLLAAVVAAPTFMDSARLASVLRAPSTKTTAKTWIEANIPAGSSIMAEGYIYTTPGFGPPLAESSSSLERDIALVRENGGNGRTAALRLAHYADIAGNAKMYDIVKSRQLDWDEVSALRRRYLIMTSAMDNPGGIQLEGLAAPGDYGEKRAALKNRLQDGYRVLATFSPAESFSVMFPHLMAEDYRVIRGWPLWSSRDRLRGPTITIWERRAGHG